ncbi:hypothetical protein [Geobacter anodireducens]|uniref:hypothetical protein n=1 Tax=Geobacter soli TaxID=1510391 RepID=UPI000AE52FD1|nr:hypothetical protein [Geobacter soli]
MKAMIAAVLLLSAGAAWGGDATSGCVICHGDRVSLREQGAEAMYLDPAQVDREVGMNGKPTCVDCHLGDPKARDKVSAHKGMLAPFLVAAGKTLKGQAVPRAAVGALQPLVPKGDGMNSMIPNGDPQKLEAAGIKRIVGIQWHDRDPDTMAYAPKVAEQTCGKCHERTVKNYNRSAKGLTKNQRAFRDWTEKQPGPQNCGMWPGQNEELIRSRTAIPYTAAMNGAMERSCNMCHASCNDCHFKPVAGKGTHAFGKPDTPSCYGEGRGSICHAGPMDRRRGAGYVRGEYAFPANLPQGAHVKAGLECLDFTSQSTTNSGIWPLMMPEMPAKNVMLLLSRRWLPQNTERSTAHHAILRFPGHISIHSGDRGITTGWRPPMVNTRNTTVPEICPPLSKILPAAGFRSSHIPWRC